MAWNTKESFSNILYQSAFRHIRDISYWISHMAVDSCASYSAWRDIWVDFTAIPTMGGDGSALCLLKSIGRHSNVSGVPIAAVRGLSRCFIHYHLLTSAFCGNFNWSTQHFVFKWKDGVLKMKYRTRTIYTADKNPRCGIAGNAVNPCPQLAEHLIESHL